MKQLQKTPIKYVEKMYSNGKGTKTNIECPDCGSELVVREGHSKFLGCSSYPKCKSKYGITKPIDMSFIRRELHNAEFSDSECFDNNGLDFQTWEEVAEEYYPSGINCKDDFR